MDTVSLPNDKQDAGIEGFPLRTPPAEGGPVEQPPLLGGADLRHVDRLPRRPWFGSCRSQGRTAQQRLLRRQVLLADNNVRDLQKKNREMI